MEDEETVSSMMNLTVEDVQRRLQNFGAWDYFMFVSMLVGCGMIGLFFAFRSKKNEENAEEEYLMGGRNMTVIPVSLSLVASFISGISLLGNGTEVYVYGTQYMFVVIALVMTGLAACYTVLPVFHEMQLSSTYEYLERRFDKKVRFFGSVLFTVSQVCWLPIVIYVPALAFNQVTGINVHIITPCVCIVCIFYTAVGGLKAVVWTDVVQAWLMIGGVLLVGIKGTYDIGGFGVVWQRCWESGRIEAPSFQVDFSERHSIWSVSIGAFVFWLQIGILNQNMIQRFLALPTLKQTRWATLIFVIGSGMLYYSCAYAGFVAYATYHDCDPLTTKLAKAKDQIVPLLMMHVLGKYPGLPGLFVAGIFSAALSSLSTGLNAMSAVVLEDFVKPFAKRKLSSQTTVFIMKGVVLVFGAICVGLVFVVEKLGAVLQLSISLGAMTNGPSFGLFCAGIVFPWINSQGAFYGGLVGLGASAFVILGAQRAIASGKLKFPMKPTSVEGCDYIFNSTIISTPSLSPQDSYVFPLFKLGYLWYTFFGAAVTIVAALTVSFCTGGKDTSRVNPMHVAPMMRKYLPKRKSVLLKNEEQELIEMLKKNKISIEQNLDGD